MSQQPSAHGQSVHSLSVQSKNNTDSGLLYIPVAVQRAQGIGIGDEVQVHLHGLDGQVTSIAFTGPQIAGDNVTIPADVMRMLGLDQGDVVEATFERVDSDDPGDGDESDDDDGDYADAIESESDDSGSGDDDGNDDGLSLDELLDDSVGSDADGELDDVPEDADDDGDSLSELFG